MIQVETHYLIPKKKKRFRYLLQAPNPAWGIKSLHPSDEAGDANIHPSVESVHNFVHKKITSILS